MGFSALNIVYITLLCKKGDVEEPKNFKLSLVHNIAKILANQLASRLNQLVPLIKVLSSNGVSYKTTSC
jgi:hypothetical protein